MVVVGGQSMEGRVHGGARSVARSRVHGEVLCTDMADTGARRGNCTDTRGTKEHVGGEGLVQRKEDGHGSAGTMNYSKEIRSLNIGKRK